jgi:hypothetical protein
MVKLVFVEIALTVVLVYHDIHAMRHDEMGVRFSHDPEAPPPCLLRPATPIVASGVPLTGGAFLGR